MTNAEQIQRITEKAKALRTKMESLYSKLPNNLLHDEEQLSILKEGLWLKKEADFFTAEERTFFDEIDRADREARQLLSDLLNEKKQIEKAEERESFYAESFRVLSLADIMEENASDTEIAVSVITDIQEIRTLATGIGWDRYEALIKGDKDRIIREIKAIIKELKPFVLLEKESIKLTAPNGLHIHYETDYFTAESYMILNDKPASREIKEMITPLLYHHRKVLDADSELNALIDTLIREKQRELVDEEPEQYTSPFPDTYYFPKDKFSSSLTKLESGVRTAVALESKEEKKRGKEITGYVLVNFEGMTEETNIDGLTISATAERAIEPFEKLVVNAVFTVWENARVNGEIVDGTATTTLHQLYRIITQNQSSDPTDEMLLDLKRILGKLATGYMELDVSEEAKHHKNMGDFAGRSGAFMQVVVDRKRVHGKMTDVVYISRLDLSPLYAYSSITNRIASVPMKQLETKSRNKNKETMVVGDYILSRIEAIPHISSTIVIDTLLNEVGIYESDYKNWKDKKAKTIRKVLDILDGYKRTGLIKGYSINKRGRIKQYSITIRKD